MDSQRTETAPPAAETTAEPALPVEVPAEAAAELPPELPEDDGAPPASLGKRRPRLVQVGALLIVACLAVLPVVASSLYRAFSRNGSSLGIVAAVVWLAVLGVAAVTIDRGLTRM